MLFLKLTMQECGFTGHPTIASPLTTPGLPEAPPWQEAGHIVLGLHFL
jgi:hypothetical protein